MFFDHRLSLILLIGLDLALMIIALYLIQEGLAQQARPELRYFVDFPTDRLPLAYAAALFLLPNFAVTIFTILRDLRQRRWPWLTTLAAAVCLGAIVSQIGLNGLITIINPGD